MRIIASFIIAFTLGALTGILPVSAQQIPDNPDDLWRNPTTRNFAEIQQMVEAFYDGKDQGRGSGYKQWKRWEYFNQHRLDAQGNIVNHAKIAFDEHHRYVAEHENDLTRATSGVWSRQGPTNHTLVGDGYNGGIGRVNVIAFHPSNASTIYLGTPAGGLWRTTNGGTTWTPLTDGMPRIGVSGIAVNYNNANTIYILTGDGDGKDTYSVGVLKTTNGGETWLSTGLSWEPDDFEFGYKLLMHPTNTNVLFAATSDGIQRTTNGGASWTQVQSGTFNDIEFKPGDPSIMYAVTRTGSSTFFRSTDGGASWSSAGITGTPTSATRIEIGVSPNDATCVFLLAGPATSTNNYKGIYRSNNSGLSFVTRHTSPNILGYASDGNDDRDQDTYDLCIAVSPTDAGDFVTGGINCWRTTDFGFNMSISSYWREDNASFEYTHADVHELVYNPLNGWLYCGSDGGIYRSTDDGVNWTDLSSGLGIMQFYKIAINQSNSSHIMGGTQDNGTNVTFTNSTTWSHIWGADGYDALIDYNNSNNLYLISNSTVRKSTDGGASTFSIDPAGTGFFPRLLMHPTTPTTVFVGSSDVHRSTNGGTNWTNLGSNGGSAIAQGVNNTSRFYAASSSTLQMSNNVLAATPTWTTVSGNTGWNLSGNITNIAVNPAWSLDVFVTSSGFGATGKVLFSSDAGSTWTDITGTLPAVPVNCIVYEPGSNDGVYVGTDIGVFYRDNDLADWVPFRNGLPNVPVFDMEINTTTNTVYAGTHGRSVWTSPTYTACPTDYFLTNANLPGAAYGSQGVRYYQASNTVNSSRYIDGGLGVDIKYKAGNYVELTTGFEVVAGSEFRAWNGACDAGVPMEARPPSGIYAGPMGGVTTALFADEWEINADRYVKVYPNPFSDMTNIEFKLVKKSDVRIYITDFLGRTVRKLLDDEDHAAGTFNISFYADELPDGVYFCNYELNGETQTTKLIHSRN